MLKLISNSFITLNKQCPRYYHILAKRDVKIQIRDQMLALTFPFVTGTKLFFAHDQYTLLTLQEALQLELQSPVELELEGTDLTMSSNLFKYLLNDSQNQPIRMIIQDQEFKIIPAYQYKEAHLLKKSTPITHTPVNDYKNMVQKGVDPSHANTLSWFLNQVNMKDSLTLVEINKIMKSSLAILRQPIRDRSYALQHKINMIDAEIYKYQENLDAMLKEAQKTGYYWLKVLLVLSIAQIMAFYYGIYMVEEWGWDVCEPFTYTLQCVSVVLGMIFYIRYRKQREIETIRWAFIFRKQTKQRSWRERWNHLSQLIKLKQNEKHDLELRKMILMNRLNYHYYVQQLKHTNNVNN